MQYTIVFLKHFFPLFSSPNNILKRFFLVSHREILIPQIHYISNYYMCPCTLYINRVRHFHFPKIKCYLFGTTLQSLIMPDNQELKHQKQILFSRPFTCVAVCCHIHFRAYSSFECGAHLGMFFPPTYIRICTH